MKSFADQESYDELDEVPLAPPFARLKLLPDRIMQMTTRGLGLPAWLFSEKQSNYSSARACEQAWKERMS